MIIILAILAAARASPLGQPSPPLVSRDIFQPPPSCTDTNPGGCRSLWDIIRSCVFTIFLCTWASVHPNVPSPADRWPTIAVRRVGLMLATLIMPEVIIGWALRQRLAAEKGWTTTHGFFAIMGGFMEYDGNRPVRVLLPEQLQSYSLTGNGDFSKISKAEIEDKSKRDFISKAVVILQTGWFAMQFFARTARDLSITELELITVALAVLNLVVYALWWDKPMNVRRGVRVYRQRITEMPIDDGDVEVHVGRWDALREALSELSATIYVGPTILPFPRAPWLLRIIGWPFFMPSQILGIGIQNQEDEEPKRVTTFYPDSWPTQCSMVAGLAFVAVIAFAFGGIHFAAIAWFVTAPSFIVAGLWILASIVSVVISITLFLSFVMRFLWKRKYPDAPTPRLLVLILGLQLIIYILHRSVLLILPFPDMTARHSYPPDVYFDVQWVSSIPHV
ncbi:hypothetical protein BC827DRAFT_1340935 [Russula dissimulans]|nr:hypothetical protein BC827DRAFT_1340935 [Russula dissimulans]